MKGLYRCVITKNFQGSKREKQFATTSSPERARCHVHVYYPLHSSTGQFVSF